MSAKKRGDYIPELDGWRALLVFLVSWYHIWQQSWLTPMIGHTSLDFLVRAGYMPVDATILLSGFLLFIPYAKAMQEGTPIPKTRDFYRRRIARILPSYLFFTLLMLFAVALPYNLYYTSSQMRNDLIRHLTFTFMFDLRTYTGTQLGAASWTLCVEVWMYAFFPLIARAAMKKPAAVMLGMAAISAYFRMWALRSFSDYNMVVNQLISFLDVYAVGMALACAYVWLKRRMETMQHRWLLTTAATALLCLCLWLTVGLLREQAASVGYDGIQAGQMLRRLPFAALMGGCMISLPFVVKPVRWLFGNPLTRFLSTISMNYYLIHQPLAVHLRRLGIPESIFDLPNQAGDRPWQWKYTFLSFGLSIVAATLMTFLVEKPAAWGLKRLFAAIDARRERSIRPCRKRDTHNNSRPG